MLCPKINSNLTKLSCYLMVWVLYPILLKPSASPCKIYHSTLNTWLFQTVPSKASPSNPLKPTTFLLPSKVNFFNLINSAETLQEKVDLQCLAYFRGNWMGSGLSQSLKKSVKVRTTKSAKILSRKGSSKVVSMKRFFLNASNGKATNNMFFPRIKLCRFQTT